MSRPSLQSKSDLKGNKNPLIYLKVEFEWKLTVLVSQGLYVGRAGKEVERKEREVLRVGAEKKVEGKEREVEGKWERDI